MKSSNEYTNSSSIIPHVSQDFDRPFTEEELNAIDAAFQSNATAIKRHHVSPRSDGCRPIRSCRLLPRSFGAPNLFSQLACTTTRFFDSSAPAKLTVRYPTLTFKGYITYSRTTHEVDEAAKELIQFVESKKKQDGRAILGFDIEWKPTFRRGVPPGKAAVMQICGDTSRCYVMHIIHSGIPKSLQSLLEDESSIKVGVNIANDGYKVFNDYNVSVKALEDLSNLANQKLGRDQKRWSLASLAKTIICKELPKPGKVRLGNWEVGVLSQEKLEYAATDAFASWYLYKALENLPKARQDGSKSSGNN